MSFFPEVLNLSLAFALALLCIFQMTLLVIGGWERKPNSVKYTFRVVAGSRDMASTSLISICTGRLPGAARESFCFAFGFSLCPTSSELPVLEPQALIKNNNNNNKKQTPESSMEPATSWKTPGWLDPLPHPPPLSRKERLSQDNDTVGIWSVAVQRSPLFSPLLLSRDPELWEQLPRSP